MTKAGWSRSRRKMTSQSPLVDTSARLRYHDLRGLTRSLLFALPSSRSQVHLTSAAVNGLPSCHLTPWRNAKVSSVPSSIAPELDRMRAHIVAVLLHVAGLIGCRDDRIGVLGGKGAAARRAAGLHKSRPPLRRWHSIEGAAALEELALEMDRVNLAPITIDAAFAVHHHRTGLPRIEELVH